VAQRAKVQAELEGAVAAGAGVVVGGDRAGHDRGHFFAPIVPVDPLDEAIALANASRHGLGANGPVGGFKRSGAGRELGREGLEAFQETKHVHIETRLEVKDRWYPYGR
jgi:betaine-aldehyde dehydrogenase